VTRARLLLLAALCLGCTREPSRPNVLLVVIDTLRADHLGAYGYDRPTSPNLDRLAKRGTLFQRAHATSSWTAPSVVSILTGLYPAVHGVEQANSVLGESVPTMAEAFARAGYATAAMAANPAFVSPRVGIGRGFARFDVLQGDPVAIDAPVKMIPLDPDFRTWVEVADAARVTDAALAWIGEPGRSERPFFLFLHYLDPHADYFPPAEMARRFGVDSADPLAGVAQRLLLRDGLRRAAGGSFEAPSAAQLATLLALYDAEIAFTDIHVGRLLSGVERLSRDTIVAVTADHGEEFGDHGGLMHGITLYQEQLHVPLILAGAGLQPGREVALPVSLASLWATLAELAGLPPPGAGTGRSLAPLARGEPATVPVPFADLNNTERAELHRLAVVGDRWKLIERRNGARALFDLATDPGEKRDLAGLESAPLASLAEELAARESRVSAERARAAPATIELSPEDRARMRALGYGD